MLLTVVLTYVEPSISPEVFVESNLEVVVKVVYTDSRTPVVAFVVKKI